MTFDFRQCGILTRVDSDEPVQSPFKTMFDQNLNNHRVFKRIANALISLCVCAGSSEPLLVAHTTLLEISCHGSNIVAIQTLLHCTYFYSRVVF